GAPPIIATSAASAPAFAVDHWAAPRGTTQYAADLRQHDGAAAGRDCAAEIRLRHRDVAASGGERRSATGNADVDCASASVSAEMALDLVDHEIAPGGRHFDVSAPWHPELEHVRGLRIAPRALEVRSKRDTTVGTLERHARVAPVAAGEPNAQARAWLIPAVQRDPAARVQIEDEASARLRGYRS